MRKNSTCVVTGATSGIGYELARIFAERGATVVGVGRDPARCAAAGERLRLLTGNLRVRFEVADLSSLSEVRGLAGRLADGYGRIDVLVNNAGAFAFRRQETVDGIERQFALNYLSAFLLTRLLLPLMGEARIIMISSGSHYTGRIHWSDVGATRPRERRLPRPYNGLAAYDQSKLALVLFTRELARRLGPGAPVSVYAADPGLVNTQIGTKGTGGLVSLVWGLRARGGISPAESAATIAWLALDPQAAGRTGLYWKECRAVTPSRRAQDPGAARRLWDLSETLCGRCPSPHVARARRVFALTAQGGSATLSA